MAAPCLVWRRVPPSPVLSVLAAPCTGPSVVSGEAGTGPSVCSAEKRNSRSGRVFPFETNGDGDSAGEEGVSPLGPGELDLEQIENN
ncbi:hypothetical protein MDA_GLEAN10003529 [Myotis davidii]|uniref:Uncharacterized protein n=1 Tax=Myotis davidii TaxID=225400 RepID=L5ME07_MYODS|nr:hypothetical protein MDA_GLEAN10003529 [Myotis davidii]